MRKIVLQLVLLVAVAPALYAQTVKFNGLGRAVVQNDAFSDTTSINEGRRTGGHTLFDMGVTVTRDDILKVSSVLRVRNEFGGFFGEGISFDFRQIKFEGIIGEVVKYEIGDLDVALTPYTIYNNTADWADYESELFGIKRDLVDYENFYTKDNTWRMQGLNLFTTLKFESGIEKIKLRAFGNRIIGTDFVSIPSRFVYGANAKITQGKYGTIGLNSVTTADIAGTIDASSIDYNNNVFTVDYNLKYDVNSDFQLGLEGEFGTSSMDMSRAIDDTSVSFTGKFYDVGLKGTYAPLNLTLGGSFHAVDKNFSSPTAQTRRLTGTETPAVFPTYNGGLDRQSMLWDRLSQDQGMYNRSISTVLMTYNPIYGNVTPYGKATPNRSGISLFAKLDSANFYELAVGVDLLSEISAENDTITEEKRSFTAIKAGGKLYIDKLIGLEKQLSVQVGFRKESTTRDVLAVDLSSTLIDFGIDFEVMRSFHVLAGMKKLTASGVEYFLVRNEFNQVTNETFPTNVEYDQSEDILAFGIKYDFSKYASFSMQAQLVNFRNDKDSLAALTGASEYDLNQIYFNYTVKF